MPHPANPRRPDPRQRSRVATGHAPAPAAPRAPLVPERPKPTDEQVSAVLTVLERLERLTTAKDLHDPEFAKLWVLTLEYGRRQALLHWLASTVTTELVNVRYKHFTDTNYIISVTAGPAWSDFIALEGSALDFLKPPQPAATAEGDRLPGDILAVWSQEGEWSYLWGFCRYFGQQSDGRPDFDAITHWDPDMFRRFQQVPEAYLFQLMPRGLRESLCSKWASHLESYYLNALGNVPGDPDQRVADARSGKRIPSGTIMRQCLSGFVEQFVINPETSPQEAHMYKEYFTGAYLDGDTKF